MSAVVLLATCIQAWAVEDMAFESNLALLQTTVLHQTVQKYADMHASESSVEQTKQLIHLLDVDNDGKVSREEVNTFATANGLDPNSIRDEFAGVDLNGNGILEQDEIASLLSSSPDRDEVSSDQVGPSIPGSGDGKRSGVEAPAKTSFLKVPNAASLAVTDTKPKLKEQSPEGDVEEYFAQVPVATVQASKSTQTSQVNTVKESKAASSVEDSESASQMLLHQNGRKSVGPAISAAQKMAEQINSEVAQNAQSMTFQAAASTLRANASAILMHAKLEARAAAQKAANEATMSNLKEINKLQSRAAKAEMRAAALRARANVETKEAYAAVAVASSSMSKIGAKQQPAAGTAAKSTAK